MPNRSKNKNKNKRSEKALKNDRKICYTNARTMIKDLEQIRKNYIKARNPYEYVSKLIVFINKCISTAKNYLSQKESDYLVKKVNQCLVSSPPNPRGINLDLQWLEKLDSSAADLAKNFRGKNCSYPASIDDLLQHIERCKQQINDRFDKKNFQNPGRSLGQDIDNAKKLIIGVILFCHDGQVYYIDEKRFSVESILHGLDLFTDGANNLYS